MRQRFAPRGRVRTPHRGSDHARNPMVTTMVLMCAMAAASVGGTGFAAEARSDEPATARPSIETLTRRLEELERIVREQQAQIQRLLDLLTNAASAAPRTEASDLEKRLAAELGLDEPGESVPTPPAPATTTSARAPQTDNYLKISLDGLFAAGGSSERDVRGLQAGGHDPIQNGFTVQNIELVLDGAVDPYFRGRANLVFQIDENAETIVELEEVYATTTSLPHGLQVKAGQYFTEFGRLNPIHPHSWDFVDQPLINGRLFGGDGLRSVGARLSWLLPTPFYSELLVSVQNPFGETLTSFGNVEGEMLFGRTLGSRDVRSLSDLLLVPRYMASVNPGPNQTVLFGASAALGPNATGDSSRTSIYGVDFFWKWKSPTAHRGFPFLKVQMEAMTRSYDAAADATQPAEVFRDHGWYGQAVWGFKPRWLVGLRLEQVDGDSSAILLDPSLDRRQRAAANLTWFPTEFSKLRLQYNHDHRRWFGDADSVWLQFEFLLGAHGAHKF